jgi:hypothetical protein
VLMMRSPQPGEQWQPLGPLSTGCHEKARPERGNAPGGGGTIYLLAHFAYTMRQLLPP